MAVVMVEAAKATLDGEVAARARTARAAAGGAPYYGAKAVANHVA